MAKLNWTYDDASGEQIATVRDDIRIRAVVDSDARNPFTDGDMNWPIVVRSGKRYSRGFTSYSKGEESRNFEEPFACFNDALLLHWQHNIAREFNSTIRDLIECYGNSDDELPEGKLACRDASVLRSVLVRAWDDWSDSDKFDLAVKLYAMCDIVAVSTTVTGYSQGDWAEVLVIALPGEIERFGCTEPPTVEQLEATADLYGWWTWGDVYGYIVERWVPAADAEPEDFDPDFDEGEWVELDDGSCWGFYGPDHDKSGLEESALECVPAEAPELEMAA